MLVRGTYVVSRRFRPRFRAQRIWSTIPALVTFGRFRPQENGDNPHPQDESTRQLSFNLLFTGARMRLRHVCVDHSVSSLVILRLHSIVHQAVYTGEGRSDV